MNAISTARWPVKHLLLCCTDCMLLLTATLCISSGVGTTGALAAGTPMIIAVSRACPYTACTFFTPTLIALSCSARTDVLSCSAGAETDRFFPMPTKFQFMESAFSCFMVSILLKTLMSVNDWYSALYPELLSNHSSVLCYNETESQAVSAWPFV